jgi:hypothetical protein
MIVELPFINWVHPVMLLVARTVYVKEAVRLPKLIGEPVPVTGGPSGALPLNNW